MVDFNAADANLVGQLPDIFHAFPNLQNLVLSHNDLFGPLPRSLALSTNLQTLHLNDQLYGFFGTVDDLFSSNPNCSLIQVWLHKNRFTGQIPDISKCNKLRNLELRDNQFTGIVPTSLMQHSSLV
ncbi:MAG: hypothetical protein Q8835_03270, partial [Sweet potato little leaf phytoplasma]|nr:hypothetical protein [Sweet potato little leaf phytoplasma]